MKDIETYEPDTPDCPETYPPLPSSVITPEVKEVITLKTIFLCIGMVVLGGGLAFLIVITGMSFRTLS